MKAEKIVYYEVSIYTDDGTNIGWFKPTELDEGDVFSTREEAEEWLESYGYNVDDANIEECEGGFEELPDLTFVDVGYDEYGQVKFKLQIIGRAMDSVSKNVGDVVVTLFHNGIQVDNVCFHSWLEVKEDFYRLDFLQKALETFCHDEGEHLYKLTPLQDGVVDDLFKKLAEAEQMGIGFAYSKESKKLLAFNARKIDYLMVRPKVGEEDEVLNVGGLRKCDIPVFADFRESQDRLVIKGKITI